MTSERLAAINACCNAMSALCILGGWIAIRRHNKSIHWKFMVGAVTMSTLFLAGYLTRMFVWGSTHFEATGAIRTVYLTILFSHIVLAIVIVPLVGRTLYLAVRSRFDKHRRIARVTLPMWGYVSVTGVVVYLMLYQFQ